MENKNKKFIEKCYDSRPSIFGRNITSTFRHYFSFPHQKPGNVKTCMIPPLVLWQILKNLPELLRLRNYLQKKRTGKNTGDIRVVFYSDNLDEVNGIANNLRHVVSYMRSHGYPAGLIGSAFNTRPCGVVENGFVMLLPRLFSMEQLGYADSELAIPHVKPLLRLLKRYPIDLVELETPSPGAWTIGICAKIAGIKVISHYRTDVPSYTKQLVKAKWMHFYVLWLMQVFYRFTSPVISPCKDYQRILVKDIKIPKKEVKILARGIPLENYHPSKRGKGTWEKFSDISHKVRFLFVGRISKEKDLPFLDTLWHVFSKKNNNAELLFVGGGWYLEELQQKFSDCPEVHFAGVQGGENLAGLYADADFFIFPSGTDTFGNVVVEAIASGTPAIVTDRGGPQDIIFGKNCGFILPFGETDVWFSHLEKCVQMRLECPEEYEMLRKNAYTRSQDFTLEHAVKEQWEYFQDLCIRSYHET